MRCSTKPGLTLIEVLAALAILSVLLAGVVLAAGGAKRQWALADRRIAAAEFADMWLSNWQVSGRPITEGGGAVPDLEGTVWSVQLREDPDLQPYHVVRVRLDVVDTAIDDPDAALLASVEFIASAPEDEGEAEKEDTDLHLEDLSQPGQTAVRSHRSPNVGGGGSVGEPKAYGAGGVESVRSQTRGISVDQ